MMKTLRILAISTALATFGLAQEETPVFSNPSIDLGIVVKDIEKSAKFYTEAMGMTEVKGFSSRRKSHRIRTHRQPGGQSAQVRSRPQGQRAQDQL